MAPGGAGVPPGRSRHRARSWRSGAGPTSGDPGGTPESAGGTPALPDAIGTARPRRPIVPMLQPLPARLPYPAFASGFVWLSTRISAE